MRCRTLPKRELTKSWWTKLNITVWSKEQRSHALYMVLSRSTMTHRSCAACDWTLLMRPGVNDQQPFFWQTCEIRNLSKSPLVLSRPELDTNTFGCRKNGLLERYSKNKNLDYRARGFHHPLDDVLCPCPCQILRSLDSHDEMVNDPWPSFGILL